MIQKWSGLFLLLIMLCLSVSAVLAQDAENGDREARLRKNTADSLFNVGNSAYRSGQFQQAIENFTAAIKTADDHRYHYGLGLSYSQTRKFQEAIAEFDKAIKLKPDFFLAYFGMANTHLRQGEYLEAIADYKEAMKDPSLKSRAERSVQEAYAGAAQKLFDRGTVDSAGVVVDEALSSASDNPKLYLIAARIYNRLEKPEQALEAAQKALQFRKTGSKGAEFFEIGIAYKKLAKYAEAREAFNNAAKDPLYARNAQYELDGIKGR